MKYSKLLLLSLLFCFCNKEWGNNPADPIYKGDYRFEVTWDSLPETLSVFSTYTIPFTITGADTFIDYVVRTACGQELPYTVTDSTISFYTVACCDDSIIVDAVRPNLLKVSASYGCVIDAGRSIIGAGNYAAGDSAFLRLSSDLAHTDSEPLTFRWYIGDSLAHTTNGDHEFILSKQPSADTVWVWGCLEDEHGRSAPVDTVMVVFAGNRPQIEKVVFPESFNLGDTITIKLQVRGNQDTPFRVTGLLLSKEFFADTLKIAECLIPADSLVPLRTDSTIITDTTTKRLHLHIENSYGLTRDTTSGELKTNFFPPSPLFNASHRIVPTGISQYVHAPDTSGKTIHWIWHSGVTEVCTTEVESLKITYDSVLVDTLVVWGIDKFGHCGGTDSLIIKATDDEYLLDLKASGPGWIKHSTGAKARLVNSKEQEPDSVRYIWNIIPEDVEVNQIAEDSIHILYDKESTVRIEVYAIVNGNDTTETAARDLSFLAHPPRIAMDDTLFSTDINTSILCTVSVYDMNPGGFVSKIFRKIENSIDTLNPADTIWDLSFPVPKDYNLSFWAIDNDGYFSDTLSANFHITSSAPVVTGIEKPEIVYIDQVVDLIMHTATSHTGGKVIQYLWRLGETMSDTVTDTNHISWTFDDTGLVILHVACSDTFGQRSEEKTDSIYIDPGFPQVFSTVFDTPVWINDTVTYTLSGSDPNGRITKYGIDWNEDGDFDVGDDGLFKHAYPSPGAKPLRLYVEDNLGFSSDTLSDTVIVKVGMPRVTKISVNTALEEVYISDNREFTFAGADSNDYIDSILVSWDGDTVFEVREKASDDSLVCMHRFAREETGQAEIVVRVKDNDGLVKDSIVSITVKAGVPVIDSIAPDTVWVVDTNEYRFAVRDTNGTVDSLLVYWGYNEERDTLLLKDNPQTRP